jgi:3-dehydroquinate synthase
LVQVPTSVVAMVDSAVGGKTGINLPQGKNLVGAFYQPRAVVIDRDTLATLPEREYVSGLAEVVKYGVIRDRGFFELMEERAGDILAKDPDLLGELIMRSCRIKAEVVGQDEREGGLRAILNFGHTLGHALEKVAGYGAFLHGEAIAVGMVYAARVSASELGLAEAEVQRLSQLLERLGLPVAAPGHAWAALRQAMSVDKKVSGGVPRFVLARRMGEVEFGCEVSEETLSRCWEGEGRE